MAGDLRDDLAPRSDEPVDPVKLARRDLQKALPRRFYTSVAVAEQGEGFGLLLDGKPVRTPARAHLVLPTRDLAEQVATEWRAQGELIDPDTMPLTKLVNSAIDGVAARLDETIADIVAFADTDLVCYRAGDPQALVAAQAAAWDPVLDFAREALGLRFICAEGVIYVKQPEGTRDGVARAVERIAHGPSGALKLAALSVMTALTGSVLLALATAQGRFSAEEAWAKAHVDEDFQARLWGADAEAMARRARRWRDMEAAAKAVHLS